MCKYCELNEDGRVSPLAVGNYEGCEIEKRDDGHYIIVWGEGLGESAEPIHYCPFCGRKLNQ
jgi:hypothetical protein